MFKQKYNNFRRILIKLNDFVANFMVQGNFRFSIFSSTGVFFGVVTFPIIVGIGITKKRVNTVRTEKITVVICHDEHDIGHVKFSVLVPRGACQNEQRQEFILQEVVDLVERKNFGEEKFKAYFYEN